MGYGLKKGAVGLNAPVKAHDDWLRGIICFQLELAAAKIETSADLNVPSAGMRCAINLRLCSSLASIEKIGVGKGRLPTDNKEEQQ